jgi:hypothetical protein
MRKPGRYRSFAWARHLSATDVDPEELTPEAQLGLEYAQELAEDAHARSLDARLGSQAGVLTIEQLAAEEGIETAEIERFIALARSELFGKLSDAAIYKRLQRQKSRRRRRCKHSGCKAFIAVTAPGQKRYCDQHGTNKARTARHRRR